VRNIALLNNILLRGALDPGPSPGFSCKGGQKPEGRVHFKNTVLDVCSNREAKRETGGADFQWGSRPPLPPRWRRPWVDHVFIMYSRFLFGSSIGYFMQIILSKMSHLNCKKAAHLYFIEVTPRLVLSALIGNFPNNVPALVVYFRIHSQ